MTRPRPTFPPPPEPDPTPEESEVLRAVLFGDAPEWLRKMEPKPPRELTLIEAWMPGRAA